MWSNCLFVALGGGLGAVGRYLLSLIAAPWSFPVMTLLTNFLGAAPWPRRRDSCPCPKVQFCF